MKPWQREQWVIPPEQNGDFAAQMEHVLDVYKRPYDPRRPVVCMDESPRQLIRETKIPIPAGPGRAERHDYEYERCGVCNVFMAVEPLAGRRIVQITERKTRPDWAAFLAEIARAYDGVDKVVLVMDNLNTHSPGSFYEAYPPQAAKALWDRFEFVYTPKHGSWLRRTQLRPYMAEIELNVLIGQCLARRIDNIAEMRREAAAWEKRRNSKNAKINWQFTTSDARIKLKRLYPTLDD
jgi:hypothetical protein